MARPVRHCALAHKAFGGTVRRGALGLTMMILLGTAPTALAQVSDVKGSKDQPLVSRYAGSVIIGYDFRKFDDFVVPLGVLKRAGNGIARDGCP